LGCCESWLLRGDGDPGPHNLEPLDRPAERRERWRRDFVADGREICIRDLLYANPIPNASAAVFRRSIYQQLGGASETLSLCGDWLLWTRMLLETDLAHVGDRLNYYRCHASTVREHHRASE